MKVHLLNRDRDVTPADELTGPERAVVEDLHLDTVIETMSGGDRRQEAVVRGLLVRGLADRVSIEYRQDAIRDCLAHPEVIRHLHRITVNAVGQPQRIYSTLSGSASLVLTHAVRLLQALLGDLRELRELTDNHAAEFRSEAFTRFFGMIKGELDDTELGRIDAHLRRLELERGALVSARLGPGNRGVEYRLRRPAGRSRRLSFLPARRRRPDHGFRLDPRDQPGSRALQEILDRGVSEVAAATEQAAEHVVAFFTALRDETGFCVGALDLAERLREVGVPICFPELRDSGSPDFGLKGVRDPGLALRTERLPVGNEIDAGNRNPIVITGANQGGKTTLLRAVGTAELMARAGLFVAADSFVTEPRSGLFTHFQRGEDREMRSGRLDEELTRMAGMVPELRPGATVLFNDSFASTNEREGSEIAGQITRALVERGIRVVYVTHMYELAHRLETDPEADPLFLRAERAADGKHTYRLGEAPPLSTSFGEDIYRQVFEPATPAV